MYWSVIYDLYSIIALFDNILSRVKIKYVFPSNFYAWLPCLSSKRYPVDSSFLLLYWCHANITWRDGIPNLSQPASRLRSLKIAISHIASAAVCSWICHSEGNWSAHVAHGLYQKN